MNFIPVSIYRAIFSGSFYTACVFSAFLVRFLRRFVLLIFHAIFFSFSVVRSYCSFSICYMFYLHFRGTSFSKQWSVNVGKRNVGSVSSTHCSNERFGNFEQVIVCWRSITLDYRGFLWFFWVTLVVFVFVSIYFFTFCILHEAVYTCKYISSVSIHQTLVSFPFGSSNTILPVWIEFILLITTNLEL